MYLFTFDRKYIKNENLLGSGRIVQNDKVVVS